MINNKSLYELTNEELNNLIKQLMEEIRNLQIDIKQKKEYISQLLIEVEKL